MAVTGFTSIWPFAFGNLADPVASALRVTNQGGSAFLTQTPYTGGWLLSAQAVTGTGGTLTALANGNTFGAGFYQIMCTGNSASADFLVSRDGSNWLSLTATAMASGAGTGSGQWSGYYPYIAGRVTWVSAGSNLTGTVWMSLDLK